MEISPRVIFAVKKQLLFNSERECRQLSDIYKEGWINIEFEINIGSVDLI